MQDTTLQSVLNKQRSDKFRLILNLPKVLRNLDTTDFTVMQQNLLNLDTIQFSLFAANIPDVSIPSKDVTFHGQTMRVTSQTRTPYDPINCKFGVDNRFRNYWVLWKWLDALNNAKTSLMDVELSDTSVSVPQLGQIPTKSNFWDYQAVISLTPLDEYNQAMCEFKFYNAFITKLAGLNFNYQSSEELACDFTFTFGQMDILIFD